MNGTNISMDANTMTRTKRLLALAGDQHYAGPVRRDAQGYYHLEAIENQAMLWGDTLAEPVVINVWVPQE